VTDHLHIRTDDHAEIINSDVNWVGPHGKQIDFEFEFADHSCLKLKRQSHFLKEFIGLRRLDVYVLEVYVS